MATRTEEPSDGQQINSDNSSSKTSWAVIVGGNSKKPQSDDPNEVVANDETPEVSPVEGADGAHDDFIEIKSKNKSKKRESNKFKKRGGRKYEFFERNENSNGNGKEFVQNKRFVKEQVSQARNSDTAIASENESEINVAEEVVEEKCYMPAPAPTVNAWSKRIVAPQIVPEDFPVVGKKLFILFYI